MACFVVGVLLSLAFAKYQPADPATGNLSGQQGIVVADQASQPEQVVQKQLNSLRAALNEPDSLRVCYGLASPENLAAIGSYDQFVRLVASPSYRPLLGHSVSMIGRPVIENSRATILVTVIDTEHTPHAFRFFLRKQFAPPHLSYWMTDGVLPIRQTNRIDFPISGPSHE